MTGKLLFPRHSLITREHMCHARYKRPKGPTLHLETPRQLTPLFFYETSRFMVEVTKRFRDDVLLDKAFQEAATETLPTLVATWKVRLCSGHFMSSRGGQQPM